jgi:hypothetical protein
VFELTAGKAPEGRPRGQDSPPSTTPEGWICTSSITVAVKEAVKHLSSTASLHPQHPDTHHHTRGSNQNEVKPYPSPLTILKICTLSPKVKDMKDISIKNIWKVVEQRKNSVHDTKLNEINRKLNVFLKHLQMKRSDYMATLPFTLYSLLLKRSDITLYSWSRCDPFQWNKIINLKNGILNQWNKIVNQWNRNLNHWDFFPTNLATRRRKVHNFSNEPYDTSSQGSQFFQRTLRHFIARFTIFPTNLTTPHRKVHNFSNEPHDTSSQGSSPSKPSKLCGIYQKKGDSAEFWRLFNIFVPGNN